MPVFVYFFDPIRSAISAFVSGLGTLLAAISWVGLTAVFTGAALALTIYNYKAEQLKKQGAPIDWFVIGNAIARPNGVAVARRALDLQDLVVVPLAHAFATFTMAGRSSRSPIV